MLGASLCAIFAIGCPIEATPEFPIVHKAPVIEAPALEAPAIEAPAIAAPRGAPPVHFSPDCERQPPREWANAFHFAALDNPGGATQCELSEQAFRESGFRVDARSPAHAKGMCQFVDRTAREFGIDPWDPAQCIPAMARYVKWCQDRFDATLDGRTEADPKAFRYVCYNWGLGNARKSARRYGWILYLEAKPHLPPETRLYVFNIVGL